jgi:ferritin-like metal-binding protein YciE
MAHKELYISWLNDAYSLEQSLIQTLENHASQAKDHPHVQTRIQQHIEETRRHADLVKSCIERLGSSTSSVKSGMSSVMGSVTGMSTGVSSDALVKNALSDYSSEHFEIASYTSLIAAAQELGDQETARICQDILRDEVEMANWLEQQIPIVTQEMLRAQAREHGS